MALYNYHGVIYSDIRIDSSGSPINPDRVIDNGFDVAIMENVKPSALDLCVVVELEGKLGVMVRSDEKASSEAPVFKCDRSDFRYESIKVFVTKNVLAGPVCIIGSTEGKYHCFEISAQESVTDVKTLVFGDRYEDCIEAVISTDNGSCHIKNLDLILGVASSTIETLAPGQVFVFGADRAGQHDGGAAEQAKKHFGAQVGVGDGLVGNSYAITTMDGTLGRLKVEIDKFLTYAMDHPEKEFLVTRVACGNAGWADNDVAPLFHRIQSLDNVPIPMKWVKSITSEDMFSLAMNVLLSSCGRATLDEWVGRLAVLYAAHTNVPLNIVGNCICVAEGATAGAVCEALIKMANAQNLSEEALNELSELRSTICSVSHEKFDSWYSGSFLTKILQRECVELAEGTLLNPGIHVKEVVNKLLVNSGCSRIYNPFAGICSLCDYSDIEYVCQEPSPILSIIAQICSGDCFTGDFMSNWIGGDCDGLACILPFEYSTDSYVTDTTRVRGQRITKQLLHRLTQPKSMKAAVVVVKKDVLTSDDYHAYRRAFIKQGHLARVIPLNECCLTNNAEDYVMLYFDFTREYESVRLACPRYFNMLEAAEQDPDFDGLWTDAVDWITEYEKVVPRDYIEGNNFCLDYDIYSVPVFSYFPQEIFPLIRFDASCDRQCCSERDFDFIQVSDLLKEAIPVDGVNDSSEIPGVYAPEFSLNRRIIAQGLAHNYETTAYSNDRTYTGNCLVVSSWGLFHSNGDNPFKTSSFNKVYTIDESKIDPNYLIGMLSDIPQFKKVYPYFESWRIPVIKGGMEEQRRLVGKYFPELLETDRNEKRYNIILFGNVNPDILSGTSLEVISCLESYSKEGVNDTIDKYGRAADAIIVDSSFGLNDNGKHYGLARVMSFYKTLPVYVINSTGDKIDLYDEDYEEYLNDNRVFTTSTLSEMIKAIRSELDRINTPEAQVRNEYALEFKAANAVQDAFKPEFDIAKEMESILVQTRKQDSRLAERSFNFFRNVRDLILGELVKRSALPSLDTGALASLITDKVYEHKNGNETEKYYMTGFLMPNNLSAGLQYLTFVSNDAVHNSNGEKDTAMSAVHILFQLLLWAQEKIDGGFFGTSHPDIYYSRKSLYDQKIFNNQDKHTVKVTERAHKRYFYADNVHIFGKVDNLQGGETIYFYQKPGFEKDPFITEDLQIYLSIQNWGTEKPKVETEKKPEKKTK